MHEVVDSALGMASDDRLECLGDVGDGVHVVELAGGNDRRTQSPIVGPDLITGEERIFSGQADRPDRIFDRIRVELEPPVIEEARQSQLPAND